jgi:hypothetical protein
VREDYHTFLNLTFQYVFNMEYKKKLGDCIILCPRHEVFNHGEKKRRHLFSVVVYFAPIGI